MSKNAIGQLSLGMSLLSLLTISRVMHFHSLKVFDHRNSDGIISDNFKSMILSGPRSWPRGY